MDQEYSLIKASSADYDAFYRLRCEKKNIAWSGHIAKPDYDSFRKWYGKQMKSDTRTIYLFLKNHEVVGYLYADSTKKGIIDVGYGISCYHEGNGLGSMMLKRFIMQEVTPPVLLTAYISDINIGSQRMVIKLGFRKTLVYDYRSLPLLISQPSKFYCWELLLR